MHLPLSNSVSTRACTNNESTVRLFDPVCGLDTGFPSVEDCAEECCDNVSYRIRKNPITNSPGCCSIVATIEDPDRCGAQWDVLDDLRNTQPSRSDFGPQIIFQLCEGDPGVRFANTSCGVITEWIDSCE